MTTLQIAFFAAAALTAAEAFYLVARSSERSDLRASGLFIAAIALLDLANGLAIDSATLTASIGVMILGASVPLLALFWLLFTADWGRDVRNDPYRRNTRPWLVLAGLAAVALTVIGVLVPSVEVVDTGDGVRHYQTIGFSFSALVFCLTCFLFGLHNLEVSFRSALGSQRQRLRGGMLVLSIMTGLAFFAGTLGLLFHRIDLWVMLTIAFVTPVAFLVLARQLIDFDPTRYGVVVTRRVASSSAVILLGGLFFIAIGLLRHFLQGDTVEIDRMDTTLAALLTLTLLLAVFAANRIGLPLRSFGGGKNVEVDSVRSFLTDMVAYRTIEDLLEQVRLFLRSTFGLSRGLLMERLEDDSWRLVPLGPGERRVPEGDVQSLADWLHRFGGPIGYDDLCAHLSGAEIDIDWLTGILPYSPGLLAPIAGRQDLAGVLVLDVADLEDDQRDRLARFLETVAGPLALAIQNSHFTEQLIQSRTQESFQKMSSFVLHDLKNSVGMLDLLLSNARTNIDNPEFQQAMLGTIKDAVRRQRRIIARLSDPGAAEAGESEPVDIRRLLDEVMEKTQVRQIEHIDLTEAYAETPPVPADRSRLRSVLENLVTNALEAMPAGGRLAVTTATAETETGPAVTIGVTDSGCGMSREFIENELFQPFSSTKKKGLGIGMFQSRETVAGLGGTISVESEPGRGTTFTITLPV